MIKNNFVALCISIFPIVAMQRAELVELKTINPDIVVDLIWATGDNEFGLVLYRDGTILCCLHKEAAYALGRVQKELEVYGYGLKVLEAFRPLWAQKIIWQHIGFNPPTENFGRHTLGTAVDVTLVDLKDGRDCPLPSRTSREVNPDIVEILTAEQQQNLQILKQAMESNGFIQHDEEWFHFDYTGWQNFKALNYQFAVAH